MNEHVKKGLQIILGAIIYVIGVNFFLAPAGIFTTGLMGIAQEITGTLNLIFNIGLKSTDNTFVLMQTTAYWALNLPIIVFGFKKVGKKFSIKTFFISSVLIQFLFNVLIIDHNIILENGMETLSSDLLSLITGSILIGLGMGMILKNQATTGGTDILAVYFSLFKGKSFGTLNLAINLVVVLWAILLTGDITSGVLILIAVYIQSYVVDVIYNYNRKSTLQVFTSKEEEISEYIIRNKRSFTLFKAQSGYQKKDINVILIVVNQEEKKYFINEFTKIDPNVFIDVLKTEGVIGNFRNKYMDNL